MARFRFAQIGLATNNLSYQHDWRARSWRSRIKANIGQSLVTLAADIEANSLYRRQNGRRLHRRLQHYNANNINAGILTADHIDADVRNFRQASITDQLVTIRVRRDAPILTTVKTIPLATGVERGFNATGDHRRDRPWQAVTVHFFLTVFPQTSIPVLYADYRERLANQQGHLVIHRVVGIRDK